MKTLKKRSEFLAVAKGGRTTRRAFVLQAAKTRDCGDPRMGYTVTKKTGNSVERNRIKRRLRAAVAQLSDHATVSGADFVLIGRRGALSQPFDTLVKDLSSGMKTAFRKKKPRPARSGSGVPHARQPQKLSHSATIHPSNTSDLVDE
ncbi:ribonuclease P protein component [Flexibacterium corallicola]|uniref:ribonuclease P protein component n=1 Tax=Flexibacterium corallicola TaxID=3037259 RepID=UPI00286F2F17|nr:ribonuclease P protein component [Pseudovibrio sp. M1P-2-3]